MQVIIRNNDFNEKLPFLNLKNMKIKRRNLSTTQRSSYKKKNTCHFFEVIVQSSQSLLRETTKKSTYFYFVIYLQLILRCIVVIWTQRIDV